MKIKPANVNQINWDGLVKGFSIGLFTSYLTRRHLDTKSTSNYAEVISNSEKAIARSEKQLAVSQEVLNTINELKR